MDPGFATGGCNGGVLKITVIPGGAGDILVGGEFTTYDLLSAVRLVRVNGDGSRDGSLVVGAGFNSAVREVLPVSDGSGDFIVAGAFAAYGSKIVERIARLSAGGALR